MKFISFNISFKFFLPIFAPCLGNCAISTAFMQMPEASMNKNNLLVFGEDYIRLSRKAFHMNSESITHLMKQTADFFFRTCVLAPYPGHDIASFFFRPNVHYFDSFVSLITNASVSFT